MNYDKAPWLKPILILGGLIWIGRSIQGFYDPNYWRPVTPFDYIAVVGTSLEFLFLSAALWGLYRLYPLPISGKQKIWSAGMGIAILASTATGISNFIEDALGVKELSFMYGVGGFGLIFGLFLSEIGALLHASTRLRVSWFFLACFIGLGFPDFNAGFVTGIAFWFMAWMENRGAK